ncbi:unnamed protein product [Ixodes pacificus]
MEEEMSFVQAFGESARRNEKRGPRERVATLSHVKQSSNILCCVLPSLSLDEADEGILDGQVGRKLVVCIHVTFCWKSCKEEFWRQDAVKKRRLTSAKIKNK